MRLLLAEITIAIIPILSELCVAIMLSDSNKHPYLSTILDTDVACIEAFGKHPTLRSKQMTFREVINLVDDEMIEFYFTIWEYYCNHQSEHKPFGEYYMVLFNFGSLIRQYHVKVQTKKLCTDMIDVINKACTLAEEDKYCKGITDDTVELFLQKRKWNHEVFFDNCKTVKLDPQYVASTIF
jgi:DNA phosphorothioation-dependent restriction protein DptG